MASIDIGIVCMEPWCALSLTGKFGVVVSVAQTVVDLLLEITLVLDLLTYEYINIIVDTLIIFYYAFISLTDTCKKTVC